MHDLIVFTCSRVNDIISRNFQKTPLKPPLKSPLKPPQTPAFLVPYTAVRKRSQHVVKNIRICVNWALDDRSAEINNLTRALFLTTFSL